MDIKEFIQNFADQFDETEFEEFQPETKCKSPLARMAVPI